MYGLVSLGRPPLDKLSEAKVVLHPAQATSYAAFPVFYQILFFHHSIHVW